MLFGLKFPALNYFQTSQIEHRRPVVTEGLLHFWALSVLLCNGNQDYAHHKNHQPNGQQGRSQDVCDLPAVACKIQATDNDAARQEATPRGHEMDGVPEDITFAVRGLGGPEGLAAREAEHGALRAARWRQLVLRLGKGALSQGDVFWVAWHDLLYDSVEVVWNENQGSF